MGCVLGKFDMDPCESSKDLNLKIRLLENKIIDTRCKREQEHQAGEIMFQSFLVEELEWKRQRERWKEEAAELRMRLEEKDERVRVLEKEAAMAAESGEKERWQGLRASFLVQHMRDEHARREGAVEKWKRLYQSIKTELDELILKTSQGERLWWGAEEEEYVMDTLQKELNDKEETIEALRKQISAMAKEGADREREVDILRQSLRILCNVKQSHLSNNICTCVKESNKVEKHSA